MSQEKIKELFRYKYLNPNSYNRISELEWYLLTEELKQDFINHYNNNNTLLPDFIVEEM